MTIKVLSERGATGAEIARLLGVSEGAVRYHVRRMGSGSVDGRSAQPLKAAAFAAAIDHWRQSTDGSGLNLAALHSWLVREHGYDGSLRSVQRFWKRSYPAPRIRARRRVETPPGAQVQVDWAHFPGVIIGNEAVDMLALHMVLSHSRKEAIVWARSKDMARVDILSPRLLSTLGRCGGDGADRQREDLSAAMCSEMLLEVSVQLLRL